MAKNIFKKIICVVTLVAFVVTSVPLSYAQSVTPMPAPGTMVALSAAYQPPVLKGIKVYPDNPFRFDFILDKGNSPDSADQLKEESSRLIKYFMASLTVPEKDLWVNLSPYEKDRIVPDAFGRTEMGRDLLAQDYLLKQITASAIYPEGETGKKFWAEVYKRVQEKYGATDIPVDTFNKVWIIPEKAVVYENAQVGTAYVVESHLKVMLESDYVSLKNAVIKDAGNVDSAGTRESQELAKNVIREIVLPVLEKEVNEGKNFAALRQVYQSLILAAWYKKKIKESILSQVYVDRNKVSGVNISDPKESEKIWGQYVEAFKKGAYNYIKEEADSITGDIIPRKYFSGGCEMAMANKLEVTLDVSRIRSLLRSFSIAALLFLSVTIQAVGAEPGTVKIDEKVINPEVTAVQKQPVLTIVDANKENEESTAPLMRVVKFQRRASLMDVKTHEIFPALDYQDSFHHSESGGWVKGAEEDIQKRLEKILGKAALEAGVDPQVANRLLFWGDNEGDESAKDAISFLRGLFGDDVPRRMDAVEALGFKTKAGQEQLKKLWGPAMELFGKDLLKQPGGPNLLHFLEINNGEILTFVQPGEKAKSQEELKREVFNNHISNIRLLVNTLQAEFSDRTSPALVNELGKMFDIRSPEGIIKFLQGMKKGMPSGLTDYLLSHPDQLAGIIDFNEKDPESLFKGLRILAQEYSIASPEDLVRFARWKSSVTLFVARHDIRAVRTSLVKALGEDLVSKLLPAHDISGIEGLAEMPDSFVQDPEDICRQLGLPQELLNVFFGSWKSANSLVVWHSREISQYTHKVNILWEKANEKLGKDLVKLLLQTDPEAVFKLFGIMDKNGFNVINGDLVHRADNIRDLYAGKDTKLFLDALKALQPVNYGEGEEAIKQANAQLRDYYLNSLSLMVSSGMLTEQDLPVDKLKALVLGYIIHTQPVKGMNNAFSTGEFGTELLKSLDGAPPLVLGVVAHEIAHKLFGYSEGAADIWAFGFLNKAGYPEAVEKLQAHLKYDTADAKTGEIHDVGRAAVKSLEATIKDFSGTGKVDWERLASFMKVPRISQSYGGDLAVDAFIEYVRPLLNEKQKAFVNNSDNRYRGSSDLPAFGKELKALGEKAMTSAERAMMSSKLLNGLDPEELSKRLVLGTVDQVALEALEQLLAVLKHASKEKLEAFRGLLEDLVRRPMPDLEVVGHLARLVDDKMDTEILLTILNESFEPPRSAFFELIRRLKEGEISVSMIEKEGQNDFIVVALKAFDEISDVRQALLKRHSKNPNNLRLHPVDVERGILKMIQHLGVSEFVRQIKVIKHEDIPLAVLWDNKERKGIVDTAFRHYQSLTLAALKLDAERPEEFKRSPLFWGKDIREIANTMGFFNEAFLRQVHLIFPHNVDDLRRDLQKFPDILKRLEDPYLVIPFGKEFERNASKNDLKRADVQEGTKPLAIIISAKRDHNGALANVKHNVQQLQEQGFDVRFHEVGGMEEGFSHLINDARLSQISVAIINVHGREDGTLIFDDVFDVNNFNVPEFILVELGLVGKVTQLTLAEKNNIFKEIFTNVFVSKATFLLRACFGGVSVPDKLNFPEWLKDVLPLESVAIGAKSEIVRVDIQGNEVTFKGKGGNTVEAGEHVAGEGSPKNTGGIDLTAGRMNIETRGSGKNLRFHIDPADLEKIQAVPGFSPEILNIQPLDSLPRFLGVKEGELAAVVSSS